MASPHLTIFAPSGVVADRRSLARACARLKAMGYDAQIDPAAQLRHQRFAGTDEERLQALHRVAEAAPSVALAARGGYGLSRLLDRLDWALLARSVDRGTRWVGYSDLTALLLGLLAHTKRPSWHGPMAAEDLGWLRGRGTELDDEFNATTVDCFDEAMSGSLEAVGFKTGVGFDGLSTAGTLWGGNLSMVCALLGTPHFPKIRGGILFLEDVAEHPYRVERMLLQLDQAGVLARQKAVLLGAFSHWKPSPLDRGYKLASAIDHLRSRLTVPVLTGLPIGHVPLKLSLPVGQRVRLAVQGRDCLLDWS